MNEAPRTFWKRPLRGWACLVGWFVPLVGVIFVVLCAIGLTTEQNNPLSKWIPVALLVSVVLTALVFAAVLFPRWVCCWRNFRRFLFGIACLITFLMLAYAEENWRGRHAWLKYRLEWEAKGEKFELVSLAPPPVPDEKNFALTPLLRPVLDYVQGPKGGVVWQDTDGRARLEIVSANLSPNRATNNDLVLGSLEKGTFADIAACAEFYRGNTNYPQSAAKATAAETILLALGKFEPELTELREAVASRPYSRFPIHYEYEPSWAILLPHLAPVKGLTRLVCMRATAELEASHSAEAFEDLKLGLRLSDSISEEPILIDHLVRLSALSFDLQTVREGLVRHAWSEAQLAEIQTLLAPIDIFAEYKHAMRGERALEIGGLDYLRRRGYRANPMDYLGSEEGNGSSQIFRLMPSGWFYQNMLTISRLHQNSTELAVDEQARRVFPEISASEDRVIEQMPMGPFTFFAKYLLPALGKVGPKSARMQTYLDAARVACSVERYRLAYGQLPATLDVMAPQFIKEIPNDVIDGKPLRYRKNFDGGYLLYSIGWNQKDDGGIIVLSKGSTSGAEKVSTSGVDAEKGDWVWQMPATLGR
jgi:hypothetical protein